MKTLALGAALGAMLAVSAAAQAQDEYLDYYVVKIKPEKRADFKTIGKKIVDANRKSGDRWLAFESTYGENNTVSFVSTRANLGAIDTAMDAFTKAMKETYGANFESIFRDFDACTVSSRSEIRRRRWDLSSNAPSTAEDYSKLVGEARWIRTNAVRVRPGHRADFEALLQTIKGVAEKGDSRHATMVSESYAGQNGLTFYLSNLEPTLGAWDAKMPSLKESLSAEDYDKYQKTLAEAVIGTETMIGHMMPELSNPPEEIVNVTRDFWIPKAEPAMAARAKKK
jgi:hypothetical protein